VLIVNCGFFVNFNDKLRAINSCEFMIGYDNLHEIDVLYA